MDEQQLINDIQKRIHYQLNRTWLNSVSSVQKDRFLNNFAEDDKLVGLVLLDMLLFHNQAQEKQLISTLIRRLRTVIYKQSHPHQRDTNIEIERFLQSEMKSTCFIPVTDENPSDSSNAWTALIREKTNFTACFYSVDKLPLLLAMNKRHIVFYDDMLGTGNQFETFLTMNRFPISESKQLSINDLMKFRPEVQYYYICMAAHEDGIKCIGDKWNQLKIIASELFNEYDSVLSTENEYWKFYSEQKRDELIKKLQNVVSKVSPNDRFTKNLPVIFERNRPSNTAFPLYWRNQVSWNALIPREGR